MAKVKILHIEDEVMFSEGIAGKLGDQFAVELACSDAQIATCLQGTQFDLILLDIDLGESRNALDMISICTAKKMILPHQHWWAIL